MSDQSMLDQLKNDGNDGNRGFVPTVTMDAPAGPTITVEEDSSQPKRFDMPLPERIVGKAAHTVRRRDEVQERVTADLSSLPDPVPIIDDKVSITEEIFKPGGDFDQMIERREAEMREVMNDPEFVAQAEKALQMVDEAASGGKRVESSEDFYDDFYDDDDSSSDESVDTSGAGKIDFDSDDDDFDEPADELDYSEEHEKLSATIKIDPDQSEVSVVEENPIPGQLEPVDVPVEEPKTEGIFDENLEIKTGSQNQTMSEDDVEITDEEDSEAEEEARLKYFKEEITKRLKPASKKIDISGYTVVKKSTKPSKADNIVNLKPAKLAKWPLINTGIIVTFKEIPGATLELVRTHINNNDARAVLNIVYDHIVGPKPLNFEGWAKSIDAQDYDHMFMGFYIACFQGSNFLPMDCTNPKCPKKVFITDDINFAKMIKFGNTEVKKKFNKINKEEPTNPEGLRASYRAAVSEHLAMDFTRPTLYSEYVEMGYLQDRYIRSHADVLDYIRFIDNMYEINPKTHALEEVYYEVVPDNPGRTVVNKINAWSKCMRTLTVDELGVMRAYINELNDKTEEVTYVRPAAVCPHCKTEVPEQEMTATGMVFLRNQLGLLTTI